MRSSPSPAEPSAAGGAPSIDMPLEFSDALREVPGGLAQKGGARAKVNATAQVEVSLPCAYNTVKGVHRDKKDLRGKDPRAYRTGRAV